MNSLTRTIAAGVGLLPHGALSRAARFVVRLRSRLAARVFAAMYDIDLAEAEVPTGGFGSIHDVFTRRLLKGARPIDPRPNAMLSPVDGRIVDAGPIADDTLPQAKGRPYSLGALLASEELATHFRGGSFLSLYLSPRDYHGVHAPCAGIVERWIHVPGRLFLVNPKAARHVDSVFARNERLLTLMATDNFGCVAVVMVGSLLVGHMRLSFAPEVATNHPRRQSIEMGTLDPAPILARGGELGGFEQGSTVLVLSQEPLELERTTGDYVRVGEALGCTFK